MHNKKHPYSVHLRSAQHTAPWIGHQSGTGEREKDQRRLGGQHSKRTYNYEESAGVK